MFPKFVIQDMDLCNSIIIRKAALCWLLRFASHWSEVHSFVLSLVLKYVGPSYKRTTIENECCMFLGAGDENMALSTSVAERQMDSFDFESVSLIGYTSMLYLENRDCCCCHRKGELW